MVINFDVMTSRWMEFDSVRGKTLWSVVCAVDSAG